VVSRKVDICVSQTISEKKSGKQHEREREKEKE
jgi:hypothetical protein